MSKFLFSNNEKTTLAGPINSTTNTCTLQSGTGELFPTPVNTGDSFRATLLDAATGQVREIVNVTALNGDTVTMDRGQEGTTPQAYQTGDRFSLFMTAGVMASFAQESELSSSFFQGTDTGTANSLEVTQLTPANASPSAGQVFVITKSPAANTGAVSLQIGSSPQLSVVYGDGSALSNGEWPGNATAILFCTGSIFQVLTLLVNTDIPHLTEEDTLNVADNIEFYANETEGGQPPGLYKTTLGNFVAWIIGQLQTQPSSPITSLTLNNLASYSVPALQAIPTNNPTLVDFTVGANPPYGSMGPGGAIFTFTKEGFYDIKASITLQQSNVNNPDFGYFGMKIYQNQNPSTITNTSNTPYIGAGQGALTYSGGIVNWTLSDSYTGHFAVGDTLFVMGYTDNVTHNAHNTAVIPQSTLQIQFLNS